MAMEFGSKYVYLVGNEAEDIEEIIVHQKSEVALSDSDECSDDDGESCLLDILDTAGQEEYSTTRDLYTRTGDGFIIVYSIIDKSSFTEAEAIYNWLKRVKTEDIHVVLVANKQDLVSTAQVQVTRDEGNALADKLGVPLRETSALTGSGILQAYETLVKLIPRASSAYKIVMLGSGAVGKSSITVRFTTDSFVDTYDPTIEDSYRKMIHVKGLESLSKSTKKALKSKSKREASGARKSPIKSPVPVPAFQGRPKSGFLQRAAQGAKSLFGRQEKTSSADDSSQQVSSKQVKKVKEQKTDANVVLISLRNLENEPNLITGDPIICIQCRAVVTNTARLEFNGGRASWTCEFCLKTNENLDITEDEIPKGDSIDFMLSPPTKIAEEEKEEEQKTKITPGVIVYCMDVSSSMMALCHVPESQVAWREERTSGEETISNVTRLHCIQKAVRRLAEELQLNQPDKEVLLTVFSSAVVVKGGGREDNLPSFSEGIDRKRFSELLEIGLNLHNEYPLKPISESYPLINEAVRNLRTTGCTALGPALTICAGFVSKIPGSEIVLCTDGEPNVGIGSLSRGNDDGFYDRIGTYARSKNVTINILSIEGASVGLQRVKRAADQSGGTTNQLNPMEIVRQLRLIAQNEVVATSVTVQFFLSPDFVFDEPDFPNNLSQLEKEVGSVRKETDLSFRFKAKDPKNCTASSVPFQVQIEYTRPDGMKCLRVLSKTLETTRDRKIMEENINVSVLGVSAMKSTAKMAEKGEGKKAQRLLKNTKRLVSRGAVTKEQKEERLAFKSEIESWDNHLTEEPDSYEDGGSMNDYSANMVQQAISSNVAKQWTPGKKGEIISQRRSKQSSVASYYAYKDDH